MKVLIESKLVNVAGLFRPAIWRLQEVNRIYPSVKAARAAGHNMKNCNYCLLDNDEREIRWIYNGKLDGYGRRYN